MALYLVTGQPGHGKTAYALDKAFTFKKEGRAVYAHGVKDLDYQKAGFTYLDDPASWEELPDGSVVLLDECYTVFPNRNPGAKVPDHVEAMARHRHRGFDFILIAQQGLQLDPFLRGLYEEHVHVRQTSVIKSKTKLKRWTQYQSNVQGHCSDVQDWVRPKYVFDYYTSTTMVTTKRRIPMWARWLVIALIFVFLVLAYLKHSYSKKLEQLSATERPAAMLAGPVAVGGTQAGAGAAKRYETATDYAEAHLPRFGTMPWSAPVYDNRATTVDPQLYCASTHAGLDAHGEWADFSCTCMTEQGTRYEIGVPECRTIARHGPTYNPYKTTQPPPVASPVQSQVVPVASAAPGSVIARDMGHMR